MTLLDRPAPETNWLTGQLLVAMPGLRDPHFSQSVIFICAHTQDGAMGVMLNRPVRKPSFEELMRQLGITPTPPQRVVTLGQGGPVEEHRGFVLHSADWHAQGSLNIDGEHMLSANLEVLQSIANGKGPEQARLLLGYASWGAGQLEDEIRQNSWLTAPPTDEILFDDRYHTKWQRSWAILKIDPAMLSGDAGRA